MVYAQDESNGRQGTIRLVRGCPCYKVFGDEKLCVNDDSILEVECIEIDPAIFGFHDSKLSMEEEQASDVNVCYASIFVNYPDNKVYCISQGWMLRIHDRDVPGDDLEDALQFLSTKDLSASAEICSECLYKFLLTLSDTFTDTMSLKDKTDEVKRYVDKFSLMIAVKHSQMDGMKSIGTEDDIEEGVDHFAFLRSYLVQLLDQQSYWSQFHKDLSREDAEDWLIKLVASRLLLTRLEFQFYSQTLQLRDTADFHMLIKYLGYILKTSAHVLNINQEIHAEIRSDRFKKLVESEKRFDQLESYAEKSRTVEHNFGNVLQILSRL
ncbi:MAG: hypothetical protein RTU92_11990 [Candidatus Thorarchaeota archaeon]